MRYRDERTILNDVILKCHDIISKDSDITGRWDYATDAYVITNHDLGLGYIFTSGHLLKLCEIPNSAEYRYEIIKAAYFILDKKLPYVSDHHETNSKENKEMFKKLSDTDYENTVAAITDEYEDKKRDAEAEYNEKLAKAEADKVTANIREEADLWAYDLYARYNALHESGFAEELSIELLKLYISSKK